MSEALSFPFQVRYTATRILVTDSRKGFWVAVSDYPQGEEGLHAARFEADRLNSEHRSAAKA